MIEVSLVFVDIKELRYKELFLFIPTTTSIKIFFINFEEL